MRLSFAKLIAAAMLVAGFALPIPIAAAPRHSSSDYKEPRTDAQIETTLRARLAKSKIGKDGFRFHVEHGVVTWEGVTRIAQHKGAATRMAKSAGARRVINNILVSSGTKTKTASGIPKARVER